MPHLSKLNRRIIILGVILLACVAAYHKQWEIFGVTVGGLLGLLKDDSDSE